MLFVVNHKPTNTQDYNYKQPENIVNNQSVVNPLFCSNSVLWSTDLLHAVALSWRRCGFVMDWTSTSQTSTLSGVLLPVISTNIQNQHFVLVTTLPCIVQVTLCYAVGLRFHGDYSILWSLSGVLFQLLVTCLVLLHLGNCELVVEWSSSFCSYSWWKTIANGSFVVNCSSLI
jgi:hypothetical protein